MIFRNFYSQFVTYWTAIGNDGYGQFTYSSPQIIDARYELRNELFFGESGEHLSSNAVVYTPEKVLSVGDYVAVGSRSDVNPLDLKDAYKVRMVIDVPSIKSNRFIYKAML